MLLHLFYGLLPGELKDEAVTPGRWLRERALADSEATGEWFWVSELHRVPAKLLSADHFKDRLSGGAHTRRSQDS